MSRLGELLACLPGGFTLQHHVDLDAEVTDVQLDSRRIADGAVFVSLARAAEERSAHVGQARAAGAGATIGPSGSDVDVVVTDPAAAAAAVACAFYRHPSREVSVIGITGTNGKSSITHLLDGVLRALGQRVGAIGTIGVTLDGTDLEIERRTPTTPESTDLQYLLRRFADRGATHVVTEASSIALAEQRLDGTQFAVGCFTNLTHDHLDVHGSAAAYEAAKLRLFDLARGAVANADDPVGRRIRQRWQHASTFALHGSADVVATDLSRTPSGTGFRVHVDGRSVDASVHGLGELSVSNALAVLTIGLELGFPIEDTIGALATVPGPPGRMQVVEADRPYTVMIDYAHSPDALRQVLRTLRTGNPGRLLTVFGCGGDRDRGKRPVMGRIAAELSDQVIVTTDNPRTEDPWQIITEILSGPTDRDDHVRAITDRTEAIGAALESARPGDLVLIAGKGSESYQIVGREALPYSDEQAVLSLTRSGDS